MSDGNNTIQLETIKVEKDLGVHITNDLKSTEQCIQAARKAQSVLGMIKRQFKIIDKEEFGIIYKTYVRPHLEYCIQACGGVKFKNGARDSDHAPFRDGLPSSGWDLL